MLHVYFGFRRPLVSLIDKLIGSPDVDTFLRLLESPNSGAVFSPLRKLLRYKLAIDFL